MGRARRLCPIISDLNFLRDLIDHAQRLIPAGSPHHAPDSSVPPTLTALRVDDVALNGLRSHRVTVRPRKTGRPVRFELTEVTRQALDDYLRVSSRKTGQYLFPGRRGPDEHMTTRQYARLVTEWVSGIGLDPLKRATHSIRRTEVTLIYRRTGNLRAVQLLLGPKKIESTIRYLGVEVDDALDGFCFSWTPFFAYAHAPLARFALHAYGAMQRRDGQLSAPGQTITIS
jgi:hypothetical protein